MKLSEVMENARLKVKRANSHIDAIIRETAALPDELYEIAYTESRSHALLAKPNRFDLTYRPKEPINKHFGAIMGDAVNNLRESLNYWTRKAIRCVGPERKIDFPFSKERKDLESAKAYVAIKKAFPNAADFIAKKIEPCRDTNLHLWAAASLCNDNKHDDFLPVVTVVDIKSEGSMVIGGNVFHGGRISGNADSPMNMVQSDLPITVENKFRVAVDVTFPRGAVFEDQPVVPTLTNMSEVVTQTLNALEGFITPYCK